MSNLITELKRRNVFRVAAAYVVGGWILIQTSDALFPALNLPDWTTRFVAGLVVLGFPVALIMSWAFEVTPDGVKRDTGELSSDGSSSKRLDVLTLIGVAFVIALVAWQKLDAPNRPQPEIAQEITVTESAPSVAVLAFENMSPDPANEFFAEGISEEILNVLAGIDGLKVASRTSAFSFANSNTPIPEIAQKLSVNHVLEGSVRKQGMRVRITAQLIDASNDRHLWSDTYDRELDDIFVVQEEIAQAISEALLGALGMEQVSVDASTNDLVAYELFLSGRRSFYRRGIEEMERSIVDLSAAVARDPEFADAWSFLAAAQQTSTGYGSFSDAQIQEKLERGSAAAQKALQLDPGQALAVAIQGQVLAHNGDYLASFDTLRRAVAMAPDDAGIHMWLADKLFRIAGSVEKSLPLYERVIALDPLSGINQGVAGIAYLMAGERKRGRELIRGANAAGWNSASDMLILDLLHTGENERVPGEVAEQLTAVDNEFMSEEMKELYLSMWRRIATNEMTGDELEKIETEIKAEIPDFYFMVEYAAVGDLDRYFDHWFDYGRPGMQFYEMRLAYTPAGRVIVEHPRFLNAAEHFEIRPVWEAMGHPFDCDLVTGEQGEHLSCSNWPE